MSPAFATLRLFLNSKESSSSLPFPSPHLVIGGDKKPMTVELGKLVTVTRFFRVAASRRCHPNAILKIGNVEVDGSRNCKRRDQIRIENVFAPIVSRDRMRRTFHLSSQSFF
jgi:hypothetical protein